MKLRLYIQNSLRKFTRATKENELAFKKQIIKCHFKTKIIIKYHLINSAAKGFTTNRKFWSLLILFWQSKGFCKTVISHWLEKNPIIKDESKRAKEFNNYYANIFEKSSKSKQNVLGTSSKLSRNDYEKLSKVFQLHDKHPSTSNSIC